MVAIVRWVQFLDGEELGSLVTHAEEFTYGGVTVFVLA